MSLFNHNRKNKLTLNNKKTEDSKKWRKNTRKITWKLLQNDFADIKSYVIYMYTPWCPWASSDSLVWEEAYTKHWIEGIYRAWAYRWSKCACQMSSYTVLKIDPKGQLSTTGKRWIFSNTAMCGTLFLWDFKILTASESRKNPRKEEKYKISNGFMNNWIKSDWLKISQYFKRLNVSKFHVEFFFKYAK